MRILIATAGRHGGTKGIGHQLDTAIRAGLTARGVAAEVDVVDAADVTTTTGYDAAVLGSAVYMGRWCKSARQLVDRAQSDLALIPVWLFSSGPIGDGPRPDLATKWDTVPWALEHRVFGGRLVRADLSPVERFVVRLLRTADGDQRSHGDIAAWGDDIAGRLALHAAIAEKS